MVALVVAAAELFRRKRVRSSVYGLMGEKVPLETHWKICLKHRRRG